MSVKAGSAGTASISSTGVDIIGEGVSVGSASISGNYTINAVQTTAPKPTQQVTQPTQQPTEQVVTPVPETTPENNLPANVGAAGLATTSSKFADYLRIGLIILIILGAGYGIYYFYFVKRKKK